MQGLALLLLEALEASRCSAPWVPQCAGKAVCPGGVAAAPPGRLQHLSSDEGLNDAAPPFTLRDWAGWRVALACGVEVLDTAGVRSDCPQWSAEAASGCSMLNVTACFVKGQ